MFGILSPAAMLCIVTGAIADQGGEVAPLHATPVVSSHSFDCGFGQSGNWLEAFNEAIARGEIVDPATRQLPPLPPPPLRMGDAATCLTTDHIFPFEDSESIFISSFSNEQMIQLMIDAGNAVLATHGDEYDFIGFFLAYEPDHTFGTAFYKLISNDVEGIGNVGEVVGRGNIFDLHRDLGLAGERMQGMVMMWNINETYWQPGDGEDAGFTRLVLGQEFEHRFAMFLPPLLDGRIMQGTSGCGRVYHWNWAVDGQASSMEIADWQGAKPAVPVSQGIGFNTDIGNVFSYTDLYLMGYVSPEEMDAGNSELRYMDNATCGAIHDGGISAFTSADIIASAGPRVPDSTTAQKDFKTAWVMFHLPGQPPTQEQLEKTVGIIHQHMIDWNVSTLGRGTMDNSLFPDCNCNGIPDANDPDLNCDGNVGPDDLAIVLANWGPCDDPPAACPGDFNEDGVVDPADLAIVLGSWG